MDADHVDVPMSCQTNLESPATQPRMCHPSSVGAYSKPLHIFHQPVMRHTVKFASPVGGETIYTVRPLLTDPWTNSIFAASAFPVHLFFCWQMCRELDVPQLLLSSDGTAPPSGIHSIDQRDG